MKVEEIKPYSNPSEENSGADSGGKIAGEVSESKEKQVEQMFDNIASRYDFMNRVMSLGQHKRWRDKALKESVSQLPPDENLKILDVATGTGDVAFRLHELLPAAEITGIDLSDGMLEIARKKLEELPEESRKNITFGKGDSLSMPFHNGYFDMITVAYGVRNFSDLRRGIREMKRVLRRGGVLCIIELSTPTGVLTRPLYDLYCGKVIPRLGKKYTGDEQAYTYLPESIAACPQRDDMAALLYSEGFINVEWRSLSFGALTYYIAR